MTNVERIYPSAAWAEPVRGRELSVVEIGNKLQVTGVFPRYKSRVPPTDLLVSYRTARKNRAMGNQKSPEWQDSPHIAFANANNDEKLIAFVKAFGPVVAESVHEQFRPSHLLTAQQDLAELRREQMVYCSALSLILEVNRSRSRPKRRFDVGKRLIRDMIPNLRDWVRQWARERDLRKSEPMWRPARLYRIRAMALGGKDLLLPEDLDGRIVICELLNTFPSLVFPNAPGLHASILYGIRPLLYSMLRSEFLHPRETAVCKNTRCRKFFELKRADQRFCTTVCSRHQRQREYWKKSGKKLRAERAKEKMRPSR